MTDADDVVALDLDDCRDPETDTVDAWAAAIATAIDSYTEVSPSGTGLRIFLEGALPPDATHRADVGDGHLEVYDADRYLTVTSHRRTLTSGRIEARQDVLDELVDEHLTADAPEAVANGGVEVATPAGGGGDGALDTGTPQVLPLV